MKIVFCFNNLFINMKNNTKIQHTTCQPIIATVVLTTLVNILLFSMIAQTKHPNEKYYMDKYENCVSKCNDKSRKEQILKEVEIELNEKFILKDDYLKLRREYDIIFDNWEQLNKLVIRQHEYISQLKTLEQSLRTCSFLECKEIEFKIHKLISKENFN